MGSSLGQFQEMSQADIEARLERAELRLQCGKPVCPGVRIPNLCSDTLRAEDSRCLVEYSYPMSIEETSIVAEEADFSRKVDESDAAAVAAAEEEAAKVPLAPFRPDWRFWTGVTLSGLGLFLYRSR